MVSIIQPAVLTTRDIPQPAAASDRFCTCYNLAPHDVCDLVADDEPHLTTAPSYADVVDLETAARRYLDDVEALKDADQEVEDARAALEESTRLAAAAMHRAQASAAILGRYAR